MEWVKRLATTIAGIPECNADTIGKSPEMADIPTDTGQSSLGEIARVFLRLGLVGFGGPAAHIALMEEEIVRRRRWLTHEEFLDLLGATNLIPGPNSTEMAIHLGHRRAGWKGLVVAGIAFILPAFLIVWFLAWAYLTVDALPQVNRLLYGLKPVLIAIVLQAFVALAGTALKSRFSVGLGVMAAILALAGVDEMAVLFGTGLLAMVRFWPARLKSTVPLVPIISWSAGAAGGSAASLLPVPLLPLFLVFLKIGAILYGGGYVLLAFLQAEFVDRRGWLTESQLLEAVAIGQITPGPLFTTATFIGYRLGHTPGAILATVAIFLPAFVFVALSGPLVPKIRQSARAGAFLDGVNAASLALMAVVTLHLGRAAIVDPITGGLAVLAVVGLLRFRVNNLWLMLAGALVGLMAAP